MPIALGQKAVTPMALIITPTLLNVSLSATMFLCLPAAIPGQTLPHADDTDASAGRLSEPFHGATYLEATVSFDSSQRGWVALCSRQRNDSRGSGTRHHTPEGKPPEAQFLSLGRPDPLPLTSYKETSLGRVRWTHDFWNFVLTVLGIAAAVSLPWSLLALWRLIRHGTPERSISQIGRAVLDALEYEGSIDQRAGDFRVYANRNKDGTVFCWIGGGTGQEQATFLRALREMLRPVDNPTSQN